MEQSAVKYWLFEVGNREVIERWHRQLRGISPAGRIQRKIHWKLGSFAPSSSWVDLVRGMATVMVSEKVSEKVSAAKVVNPVVSQACHAIVVEKVSETVRAGIVHSVIGHACQSGIVAAGFVTVSEEVSAAGVVYPPVEWDACRVTVSEMAASWVVAAV